MPAGTITTPQGGLFYSRNEARNTSLEPYIVGA
jgi:hypothetical protein